MVFSILWNKQQITHLEICSGFLLFYYRQAIVNALNSINFYNTALFRDEKAMVAS